MYIIKYPSPTDNCPCRSRKKYQNCCQEKENDFFLARAAFEYTNKKFKIAEGKYVRVTEKQLENFPTLKSRALELSPSETTIFLQQNHRPILERIKKPCCLLESFRKFFNLTR